MSPLLAGLLGAGIVLLVGGLVVLGIVAVRRRHAFVLASQPRGVTSPVPELVAGLPVGVAILGLHDNLLATNDAARHCGAVKGTRLGYQELMDKVREVRLSREPFDGDIERARLPGQAPMQLRCHITPLDDQLMMLVAFDDAQQRRVDTMRRDFVANISHELKTPIGAISVLAEATLAAKNDPEAVERFSYKLQSETARLSELVKQIIDLSRLQSEEPVLSKGIVDPREVVAEAQSRVAEAAKERNTEVIVAMNTNSTVFGDRWQLIDALTNLLQNAINYSDDGSRVTVTFADAVNEDGEPVVELKVSDNGIGISAEDQKRIFERFYRVDYGRSRSMGGTGLGLSIVRHIAMLHDGSVSVWSRPGQGSTFTMRIPTYFPEEDQ